MSYEPVEPLSRRQAVAAALAHVRTAHRQATVGEANLGTMIREAIALGATWDQVAKILGVTRQAAHKRYAGSDG